MDVFTVNVGQGSLSVVRHDNEAIIVDSRIPPSNDQTVAYVKQVLAVILKNYYVKGFILTGFDSDHSDAIGTRLILFKYRPDWIMYPKYYKDTDSADDVFEVISEYEKERGNESFKRVSVCLDKKYQLDLSSLSNSFKMKLYSPHTEDMNNSNNSSIVIQLIGIGVNSFSYLITGDTENYRWGIINSIFGVQLKSDVMAAAHHGSINGINAKSLLIIQPNTVLISAGVNNQYGHPSQNAVAAYSKVARHVFSTNLPDGGSLWTRRSNGDFTTTRFN